MKNTIYGLIIFLVFPLFSMADEVLKSDEELAVMGNSGAAFRIGARYLNGDGVSKDYEKAKKYLEMAASKNHAHALYDLGYMYLYGVGVDKDYMMAFDYFQRSAEFDFAPAYYIMGIMYYDGAGVKKNDKKAYEYCKKAFEKGYKTSVVELDHKNKTIIIK